MTTTSSLLAALIALAPASEPYSLKTSSGTVEGTIEHFSVPENRSRADSRSIEIYYLRLPSRDQDPGPPIVYLAGGPGGSGINAVRYRHPLLAPLQDVADVIALDQRGTGRSNHLDPDECETRRPRPGDRPLDHQTLIELEWSAARECADLWRDQGVDLSAYHTMASVADIEALRRHLGAETITLLGISYGTHLGLAYLRTHPERVHRAIFAGVEGPDHTVKVPGYSQRQFQQLVRLIEQDPATRTAYPDFEARVRHQLEALENAPVTLEFQPPDAGESTRLVVGRPDLERQFISLLRDPDTLVSIPSFLDALENGQYALLGASDDLRFEFDAMGESMDAASGASDQRIAQFHREAESSLLGGGAILGNAGMAKALGVDLLPDSFRAPIESDLPTLFISGTLDGRTPPENAVEVSRGFRRSSHLVIENAGHSNDLFFSNAAIVPAIQGFLNGKPVPERMTTDPPDFDNVRQPVTVPSTVTDRYLGEYRKDDGTIWRVISMGNTRALGADGNVLSEDSSIQYRVDDNGFTMVAISEDSFYVPLPWWMDRVYRFLTDESGRVVGLEVQDPGQEPVRLERLPDR